jgi:hypothetical protein
MSRQFGDLIQNMADDSADLFEQLNAKDSVHTRTECSSAVGISVGLIDGIIASCRVLAERDLTHIAAQEALKDLRSSQELAALISDCLERPNGRIFAVFDDEDAGDGSGR